MNRPMRVVAALATLVLAIAPVAASAQDAGGESLVIRRVDTTEWPQVKLSVLLNGSGVTSADFTVREAGEVVRDVDVVPVAETSTPVGIVLAIDVSGSMKGAKLDAAKSAAQQFISLRQPNQQIALVTFSDQAIVLLNFTDDVQLLDQAIDGLSAHGETALWDGVRVSSALFGERPELLPTVVVLSDGADTVSATQPGDAVASAAATNSVVFAVGLVGGGESDRDALAHLAAATGGQYLETTNPGDLERLYSGVQGSIQSQYEVTYTSSANDVVEVAVTAGELRATATATPGSVSRGSSATPRVIKPPSVPAPLQGPGALALVVGLITVAAVAVVASVAVLARPRRSDLDGALAPYFGSVGAAAAVDAPRADRSLAQTAIVRRAVDATARLARERGILDWLESRLEIADLRLRPQEALFFYVALVLVVGIATLALGGPVIAAAVVAAVALAPIALLNLLADRRQRAFGAQLPDTLQLLASSLRAGYSLAQGIETVSREITGPMGRELRRVVVESSLGRPIEDALADSSRRMQSPDFDWAVIAINIQRQVGGNLAELLTTVSETMIARERLRREVRALTAEGRFSAIILLALPIVLGGFIFVLNPAYMTPLFSSTLGQVLLLGSGLLAVAGFVWMRKIIEIKV